MALPTNTYTRYTVGTNAREDLIDKITNSSPEKTPVISSFGRATAENTYHEWQRDSLRAANKDNAALDGDDATGSAKAAPGRVANYCQIFQDTIVVSGRAEIVKKAGMKSALAYHKAKAYKELQRDMEAALLSSNVAVAGATATAPKAAGLGALIYTNVSHGVGGSTTAHTSGAPTVAPVAGTGRAFSEALLKTVLQSTYTQSGGIPSKMFMSPFHKGVFSTFVGIAANRVNVSKGQGTVLAGADVFTSDFGDLQAVPHYIMAGGGTVFGIDSDSGDVAYLRGFSASPLGKTGDSVKEQVLVDATFRLLSEVSNFKIADLTAA